MKYFILSNITMFLSINSFYYLIKDGWELSALFGFLAWISGNYIWFSFKKDYKNLFKFISAFNEVDKK